MPALPSPGKVVRCDLFFTLGANVRVRDRIFFSYTGAGPTVTDLNTLATTISAGWNTNMVPQTATSMTLTGITLTDLASASGAQTVTSQNRVGTLAGTPMAAGVAMIIKFKIARRYRGGHPRYYHGGRVVADLSTSTTWLSASITSLVNAWIAFIAFCVNTPPASLGTLAHANVSYFSGFVNTTFPTGRTRAVPRARVTPLVDAVTSYSGNNQVGSQRRRNLQSA
jgi:hypothetical protein